MSQQEEIAIIIAASIWRRQPDMSGDPWVRLMPHQKRAAMDAAYEVILYLKDQMGVMS